MEAAAPDSGYGDGYYVDDVDGADVDDDGDDYVDW